MFSGVSLQTHSLPLPLQADVTIARQTDRQACRQASRLALSEREVHILASISPKTHQTQNRNVIGAQPAQKKVHLSVWSSL